MKSIPALLSLALLSASLLTSAIPPRGPSIAVAGSHSTLAGQHGPRTPSLAFTFTLNGNNFVYSDAERTFTGILIKPSGNGPFPAAIVSHGQGGSAIGYSLGKAQEFLAWGMVSIAPNYTHAAGGSTQPAETGNCPENIARGLACLNVLKSLDYVDDNRVVLWGHSKGAFVTIGLAAAAPGRFVAAGMSAGGVIPDSAGTSQSSPTVTEAAATVAPFLMFHGDGDMTVSASQSLLFKQLLDAHGVPNQRFLYVTNQHNLHQVPSINADMLVKFEAWLQTHGVLP